MPARKYISKINNNQEDIYLKDVDARNAIQYEDVYIGAGASSSDVMVNANHYDQLLKNNPVSITATANYLWVIMPEANSPKLLMNGIEVPMALDTTVTVESINYKVWKSSNTYTGSFNLYVL